jgi:hypothetical protein
MSSIGPSLRHDRTVVSLEPRTATNCLDVATMFCGRHVAAMLRAWLVVTVPAVAVVYWLAWWHGFDVRSALVAVYAATAMQGVLIVLASIPALFGEPLRLTTGLTRTRGLVALLTKVVAVRVVVGAGPALMFFSEDGLLGTVGFLVTVFPCGWIGARSGFLSEKTALVSLDPRLHDRQTDRVIREQTGDLYSRACWIVIYYVMLWAVAFVTVDFAWYLLAGDSPLVGRVLEMAESMGEAAFGDLVADLWHILVHDAYLQVELTAAGLLVYPIARLAWLFCYLDARVRRDCWDMQLQFAHEVNRLTMRG